MDFNADRQEFILTHQERELIIGRGAEGVGPRVFSRDKLDELLGWIASASRGIETMRPFPDASESMRLNMNAMQERDRMIIAGMVDTIMNTMQPARLISEEVEDFLRNT